MRVIGQETHAQNHGQKQEDNACNLSFKRVFYFGAGFLFIKFCCQGSLLNRNYNRQNQWILFNGLIKKTFHAFSDI